MGEKEFWEKYYEGADYRYGEAPSDFLAQNIQRLHKGLALDIGMGEGQNAACLAENGFSVSGFDISENAVKKARDIAGSRGVQMDAVCQNLDFYIFPVQKYDTVIMAYYKPASRFYSDIKKTLRQGGTFLCEGFLDDAANMKDRGREIPLSECYRPNELLRHISGLRLLFYEEGLINGMPRVRCLAQKPLDKDAVRYGIATAQNSDESAHHKRAESLFKPKK